MAKCILGDNVKVFGRCVQALAKIGEDLLLEPSSKGLAIRAVNSDQSAFASFTFIPDFFMACEILKDQSDSASTASQEDNPDPWIFRISMKCATMVFRSHSAIDKGVNTCEIQFDIEEKQVRFHLSCKHDVNKIYKFPILESEKLSASFDKTECQNSAVIHSKILLETCNNFQSNTEELCVETARDKMTVRNFIQSEPERNKAVKTEVVLASAEFDQYHIERHGQLSFCVKEFKAILVLAESLNLPVSLYFDRPGKPFICSIESEPTYTGDSLLATLADIQPDGEEERIRGILSQELENLPKRAVQQPVSTQPIMSAGETERDGLSEAAESWRPTRVPSELQADEGKGSPEWETDPDVLPATPPPSKKFRSKFLNLSQATLYASQLEYSARYKVLAEDSDVDTA